MNKKGASLSGFTEAGIGVLLILGCLVIIVTQMNLDYNKNYDSTFGMGTNETKYKFEQYQNTLQEGIGSEASTNSVSGVSVVGSWGIIKAGLSMILDMVSGSWILNMVALLNLGQAGVILGWSLRLLFILAISFIMIKILFKVKP